MADDNANRELNRLYWESEASVSDIADRLDISRRALYDGIEPRPAGRPCPECGAPLGFRNRTALETGEAECPECGYETELEVDADGADEGAASAPSSEPVGPPRRVVAPEAPALGAAFAVGLAVGAVITYVAKRG